MIRRAALFLFAAVAVSLQSVDTSAQPKPGVPPVPPPQYPTLTTPASLGAKLGATTELMLIGTNLTDAVAVWVGADGVKATIADGQKDATKLKIKLEVPATLSVGMYPVRVATKYGISNFRPINIDDLPEIVEKEGNSKKDTAQVVPVPCVVTGNANPDASDFYKVNVAAGQRLAVEVLGRRIGSQLDPVILLHDAKTVREMPGLFADDTPGLQSDARVTHTFKLAAEILIEVRDTTYRGGADFSYRLRIGDFPGATTTYPLAIERGKSAAIGFTGPNVDGAKPVTVKGAGSGMLVSPKRDGGVAGWSVSVGVSDFPEAMEVEPNNEIAKANKLPVPSGISGKFETKSDVDFYSIAGKKGQKLEIVAHAFEYNSPAEVYLKVVDAKGAELAKSNPSQANARIEFTPAVDGEFFISAEHLNYLYGLNEVYHLSVKPAIADFAITLGLDRVDVSATGGSLPVTGLTKLNGFNLPIELVVVSDAIAGKLTLAAAANPLPTAVLTIPLTLKPGVKPGAYSFSVQATAKVDGKDVVHLATVTDIVKASLGAIPNPSPELLTQLAVAVVDKPLFALTIAFEKPEVLKGAALKGKVIVKRAEGFTEEIVLVANGLPANVTAKVKPIPKGTNEVEIEVNPVAAAAVGPVTLTVRATAKASGRDFAYDSSGATFAITEPKKPEPKKEEPKKK